MVSQVGSVSSMLGACASEEDLIAFSSFIGCRDNLSTCRTDTTRLFENFSQFPFSTFSNVEVR